LTKRKRHLFIYKNLDMQNKETIDVTTMLGKETRFEKRSAQK